MNFDPLFEDLEALFCASATATGEGFSLDGLTDATSIELVLHNGQRQTIVAPLLGQGFVAGVHPEAPNWVALPLASIRSLGFGFEGPSVLPALQFSEAQLQEHLQQLQLPAQCCYFTQNPDEGLANGMLLGVARGLMFVQLQGTSALRAIPLIQVAQLKILAVDNSGKDF